MKRLLALAAGALGIRAWLRTRRRPPATDPPVDELRQKLADAKATEPEAPAAAEPADVEARRADVHERARKAIDDLS